MTPSTRHPRGAAPHPLPVGKVLTSVAAVLPVVGAFAADWNDTHVFNPRWPPHAKFHNAQTITLAVMAAGLSLWETWRPGPTDQSRLTWSAITGGLFWLTQTPAAFFPGSALVDQENPLQPTKLGPIPLNQVTITGAVVVPLILAGHTLGTKRLSAATRSS